MNVYLPNALDHSKIQILVKPLDNLDSSIFNSILQRLSQAKTIEVSDNPRRFVRVKFVTNFDPECAKFGEFQAFRKIFGVLCIGQRISKLHGSVFNEKEKEAHLTGKNINQNVVLDEKESSVATSLDDVYLQYQKIRDDLRETIFDSRCILFGYKNVNQKFDTRELLLFPRLDDSDELKVGVCEFIYNIYIILESRRLNKSFEKMENPNCPLLPEEEKYRIGLENTKSKIYRRKCIGRNRKQIADYCLLTGLSTLALEAYQSSIECLEQASDFLWLAAAYEGWCASAILIKYKDKLEQNSLEAKMQRMTFAGDPPSFYNHKSLNFRSFSSSSLNLGLLSSVFPSNLKEKSETLERTHSTPHHFEIDKLSQGDLPLGETSTFSHHSFNTASSTKTQTYSFTYTEILAKFHLALENYTKYSFASFVECECVVRKVDVYIFERMYIEAENFIHERMAKFLDDNFHSFDNKTKAHICLICASICKKIGFQRKNAFYLRLSVLFRLNVASDSVVSEAKDYQEVYPILYNSLCGYGICADKNIINEFTGACVSKPTKSNAFPTFKYFKKNIPFSIQVKAVYEVFISASRAGYFDVAIRHLCFILQNYFENMTSEKTLSMIDELEKLVAQHKTVYSLAQPIALNEFGIILPPVQFNRFPILSNFKICSLPPHLAPNVVEPDLGANVFIYSPFQNLKKNKHEIHWVVDCACEVLITVRNPLPIELMVKNLSLLTEGCTFEAIPVRLNLPSCYGNDSDQNSAIKLLGVPRSAGILKLTGYSCEVLGVRNVCSINNSALKGHKSNGKSTHFNTNGNQESFTVRVLEPLPLLSFETSLKMTPTTDNSIEKIAELTVFSGQKFEHSIHLHNTSNSIAIKHLSIKVDQSEVCGGPKLIEILDSYDVYDILPGEKREIKVQIFGIDPSASTATNGTSNNVSNSRQYLNNSNFVGEEHRVYVRRHTSLSNTNAADISLHGSLQNNVSLQQLTESHNFNVSAINQKRWSTSALSTVNAPQQLSPSKLILSSSSTILPSFTSDKKVLKKESCELIKEDKNDSVVDDNFFAGHDLIPYIGRLLSAEFIFTYTADVGTGQETYERVRKLPFAIAIVPAVNVSDWHILAGDSPMTRYVVVDVTNLTDVDAELTYGDGRMIWVQPKEVCRVPLLCPCCTEIQSSAFSTATQQASHMMQMREVERLRKTLEKHVSKYLDIRWRIPVLKLDGFVPVGLLLSSVSFLKQLVIPAVSVSVFINEVPYISEDDIVVGIGELINFKVKLLVSLKQSNPFCGEISLTCYQDLQNNKFQKIICNENFIICGPCNVPFSIRTAPPTSEYSYKVEGYQLNNNESNVAGVFEAQFSFLFRYEGVHKIQPELSNLFDKISNLSTVLSDDDIFIPCASFNVTTKVI